MTAVNPVYMNPALASLVEFEFGAENTLESLDRVIVRYRAGTTEIAQDRFRAYSANYIQAFAQRLVIGPGWESVGTQAFLGWSSATSLTLAPGHSGAGVTGSSANNSPFNGWASLKTIDLPTTTTTMGNYFTHSAMTALETIIVRATTPPTITANTFAGIPAGANFYVPDASVAAYKAATIWSTYAARIHGLSELP